MADYRLKNQLEHEIFYVNERTFRIVDRPAEATTQETIEFQLPSFAKWQEMQQAATIVMLGSVDERALDMIILRNCLKCCTFFKIELKDEVIEENCFAEMIGDKGVPPSILSHAVRLIRSRL